VVEEEGWPRPNSALESQGKHRTLDSHRGCGETEQPANVHAKPSEGSPQRALRGRQRVANSQDAVATSTAAAGRWGARPLAGEVTALAQGQRLQEARQAANA